MPEFAEIRLRKEVDALKGEQISAYVSIPGAIVAATGDSMKDALQMLADALDENDQPFWAEGTSEQASPTKCSSPYHRPTSMFCLDCIPPDAPISVLLLSNRRPTEEETKRGLDIAKLMEQASPTPDKCPTCGSTSKNVYYAESNDTSKRCDPIVGRSDAWHSSGTTKSRDTGVSLDGGKTIHSKFKND